MFAVKNTNELPDIVAKIGMELRNQYILGYYPSNNSRDARWRKIQDQSQAARTERSSASNRVYKELLLHVQLVATQILHTHKVC
jgi:hypothetical protein